MEEVHFCFVDYGRNDSKSTKLDKNEKQNKNSDITWRRNPIKINYPFKR